MAALSAITDQAAVPHRKVVIDSGSTDETVTLARKFGFEVKEICKSEFNHGGTRQLAVELVAGCDLVVFLTQDAILADRDALGSLIACFRDPSIAVAYGRQLPHVHAMPMEAHARLFSYGDKSQRKERAAMTMLGAKSFFCSNSFAAYRREILLELGGFSRELILGEDAEFAARAVLAGYSNFYCAEARAYHSHAYTTAEVLRRYFDTGVFHARTPWLQEKFGSYRGEGLNFVKSELCYLSVHAPLQIPRSFAHTLAKIIGYRLGRIERILPLQIKRRLSMAPRYWQPRKHLEKNLEDTH
jgi:rhamnosyltransferase